MTEQEKTIKFLSAQHDIETLQTLLDHKKPLYNAEPTVSKIMTTPDYTDFIALSRIKYKIPLGTQSFGSLKYQQQRNIIIMLKDAVCAFQADLAIKPIKTRRNHLTGF